MNFHKAPNTYVDQVNLYVQNTERSKDFYSGVLGLRVLKETKKIVTFAANGSDPLITVEQTINVLPQNRRSSGLYHLALRVPTRKDLAAVMAHLLKEEYPLVGGADHAVSEALYLNDPDGNGVEIYCDRPSEKWKWENGRVFMPTNAMDKHLLDELNGESWTGLSKETIMGHLHLQVANLKEAEKFYLNGLGFNLAAAYEPYADFISTGGYHHHLGLNVWNSRGVPVQEGAHIGLNYYRLIFPDRQTRREAIDRLIKLGVFIEQTEGHTFAKDPSGIKLELAV
ncbi:VOC family protein [Sporolactobacillus shoreicorticis]|uniref:VOC family protein n=1 Tax=Sporolactobacillus shoreicorticis TaxID=1923877 RepID=A0ABW5S7W9_9BACL|nr:VOC family protein [Sporolactobacillus shoreicorticis]MCO7125753.1 VOC family protein [Sporolactobacillus shoreicorticis]